MSNKSAAKPFKVPRELEAIKKEYFQTASDVGNLEYEIYIKQKALDEKLERMRRLTDEANARDRLNAMKESQQLTKSENTANASSNI